MEVGKQWSYHCNFGSSRIWEEDSARKTRKRPQCYSHFKFDIKIRYCRSVGSDGRKGRFLFVSTPGMYGGSTTEEERANLGKVGQELKSPSPNISLILICLPATIQRLDSGFKNMLKCYTQFIGFDLWERTRFIVTFISDLLPSAVASKKRLLKENLPEIPEEIPFLANWKGLTELIYFDLYDPIDATTEVLNLARLYPVEIIHGEDSSPENVNLPSKDEEIEDIQEQSPQSKEGKRQSKGLFQKYFWFFICPVCILVSSVLNYIRRSFEKLISLIFSQFLPKTRQHPKPKFYH